MKKKHVTYKIVNEFKIDNNKTNDDLKLIFNKKLLKVILLLEKNIYDYYNF